MATRSGTLARIRVRAAAPAIVEEASSAHRPPDRRCATPCASGGWGRRCGGRPAGYWDHGAPTPRRTAKRPLIGRLVGVHRSCPAGTAHASASRTSRSRSRTRSCWATSRSRTIVSSPVSPDGLPARPYAVVRRTRRRGGAVRGAAVRAGWGRPATRRRLCVLRQIGDKLVAGVEEFLLVDDVVAVEDGAALVPGQEHGDPLGDAGADQFAGGGAAAIVKEAGRHPGRVAGGAPRRAPAADVVAEVGERAEDPRVASRRILTRHPHDESFVEYAVTGSSFALEFSWTLDCERVLAGGVSR